MGRSKQLATIIESAPSTLDTLNELAAALGDDANFSTTVTNSIATKLPLTGGTLTGTLQVEHGTTSEYVNSIKNTGDNLQLLLGTTTGGLLNIQGKTINSNAAYKISLQAEGGNVGIGTTSPADKMHIYNDSGTTMFRADVNANSTVGLEINKTGSTTQSWKIADGITHNGALQFYDATDAAVRMHIDGDGRVGIGTTNPSSFYATKLVVNVGDEDGITIYNDGANERAYIMFADGNSGGNERFRGQVSYDHNNDQMSFTTAAETAVTIDNSGNVMLGTGVVGRAAEGAHRLTIANDTGPSGLTIRSGTGGTNYYGSINFSDSEGGTGEYAGSIYYAHGTLGDKLVLATTGSDRITISGSGPHVGIGKTDPTYALDIKGANFQDSSIRLERSDTGASNDPGIYFVNNQSTTSGGLGGIWFTNSYHSGNAYAMIRARTQETTSSGKLQFITSNGVVGNATPAKMTLNHAGDILYGGQFNFHVISGFSAPNVAFQYDFYRATYGIPIKVTAAISHWNSSYMSYTEGMYWGFNTAMTSDVQHSYNGGNGSWTISFPTNDIIRVRMNGDASYNYASGWYIKVEGNLRREYTSS